MNDKVATKICTGCHQEIYTALFPSTKHSECKACHAKRMKKYRKKMAGDPHMKWGNCGFFCKKGSDFEWEKHIDLQENN